MDNSPVGFGLCQRIPGAVPEYQRVRDNSIITDATSVPPTPNMTATSGCWRR